MYKRVINTMVALKLAIREAKLNPDKEYIWFVTLEDEVIDSLSIDCPNVTISFDITRVEKDDFMSHISFNVNKIFLKVHNSYIPIKIYGNTFVDVDSTSKSLIIECYDNSILDFRSEYFSAGLSIRAYDNAQIINYYGNIITGTFTLSNNASFIGGVGGIITAGGNSFICADSSQVSLREDFTGKAWCSRCRIATDYVCTDKAFVCATEHSFIINYSGMRIETDGTCGISNFYPEAEIETPEFSCAKYKPDGIKKFYKAVINNNGKLTSVYDSNYTYEIGKVCQSDGLDIDRTELCSRGIYVAPLDWCIDYLCDKNTVYLEMEIPDDAEVVVPYATEGKIRVSKAIPIRQLTKEELENNEVYQLKREVIDRIDGICNLL